MDILAHRGFWQDISEQNTNSAIEKAFAHGYGVETDLRDRAGEIVISHDCPENEGLLTFDDLLILYKKYGMSLPLALNVKADGLQQKCKSALETHEIDLSNIFFFDMSVPDGLVYLRTGLPCFTRYSDEESEPSFLDRAIGVWVDGFQKDCSDGSVLKRFLEKELTICLVSPELHKRSYEEVWQNWRSMFDKDMKSVMICTDFPHQANEFFNGELFL